MTVGPNCVLRACTIEPECIVGAASTLTEGSYMGTNSILGPGSVLTAGQRVPSGEYWAGNPAKFVRELTEEEKESFKPDAEAYYETVVEAHRKEMDVTPYGMEIVWELEKLGYGPVVGYHNEKH